MKNKPTKKKATSKLDKHSSEGCLSEDYKKQRSRLKRLLASNLDKNLVKAAALLDKFDSTPDDFADLFTCRVVTKIAKSMSVTAWSITSRLLAGSNNLHDDFTAEVKHAVKKLTSSKAVDLKDEMLASDIHESLMPTMIAIIKSRNQWDRIWNNHITIGDRRARKQYSPPLTLNGAKLIAAFNPIDLIFENRRVKLTDEIVAELANNNGIEKAKLDSADFSSLTPDSFGKLPGSESLQIRVKKLAPDAAETLSHRKRKWLEIGGLQVLSPEAASGLKHFKGMLLLPDVTSVSVETAEQLGQFMGNALELPRINSITEEAAKHLANCHKIELDGLEEFPKGEFGLKLFSIKIAQAIKNGWGIECKTLTHEQIDLLLSKKYEKLESIVLHSITQEIAERLGQVKIDLRISKLSPKSALALSEHKKTLELGVTKLTRELAEALAQHRGPIYFQEIRALSEDAARELCAHKAGIEIYDHYEFKMQKEAIEALSSYEGKLDLPKRIQTRVDAVKRKKRRGGK